ncbi:MAG: type IX secretion system outer membrane channel protein PorV [Flavobacteriales bacterium]
MYKSFLLPLAILFLAATSHAQLTVGNGDNERNPANLLNTITTAVPFLGITPDSRSGAMGDAGVALSPDANSTFWNPAKLAFAEEDLEVSLSYSPWLRQLVNDMSLAYLSGYKKLNKNQSVGGSLRYFTLGNITFTDEVGTVIRDFKPAEFAIDCSFGQKFSEKLSGGIAIRFVNSNLTGGTNVNGADSKPGISVPVDISMFYTNDDIEIAGKDARINLGANIANIGNKMRYTNSDQRDFIPTNLKLGSALTMSIDDYQDITLTLDFNKLLVPTPPRYAPGGDSLLLGMDPDVGVATGIVQSFYDAPGYYDTAGNFEKGSVLKEELREINIGGGFEYWYDKQFAFRTGYFFEHYTKGNRQFITLGAGLKYQVVNIDMSYLISTTQQNPLANTLRFSLRFTVGAGSGSGDEPAE